MSDVCATRGEEAPLTQANSKAANSANISKVSEWQKTGQAQLEALIAHMGYRLGFSTDERTGRIVCRIYDPQTDEVLRQIPPQEMLDLAAKMEKMIGLIFDRVL